MCEEIRFSELKQDSTGWTEAEVQIETDYNKLWSPSVVSMPSRSPGLSVLLCAHCVFFNYMEWDFVQFHTCANMQQLFLISDNDSLKFKWVCLCVWASMHVCLCLSSTDFSLVSQTAHGRRFRFYCPRGIFAVTASSTLKHTNTWQTSQQSMRWRKRLLWPSLSETPVPSPKPACHSRHRESGRILTRLRVISQNAGPHNLHHRLYKKQMLITHC